MTVLAGGTAVVRLQNCTFEDNTVLQFANYPGPGAGLFVLANNTANVEVADCTFVGNDASGYDGSGPCGAGAGVVALGHSRVTWQGGSFRNKFGFTGEGLCLTAADQSNVTIGAVPFEANRAEWGGGAAVVSVGRNASVSWSLGLFTDNSVQVIDISSGFSTGGAVQVTAAHHGDVHLLGGNFQGNSAGGDGGAVAITVSPFATVMWDGGNFTKNEAMGGSTSSGVSTGGSGGAAVLDVGGTMVWRQPVFDANVCLGAAMIGGGGAVKASVGGWLELRGALFTRNTCPYAQGGAVQAFVAANSTLRWVGGAVLDNSAPSAGGSNIVSQSTRNVFVVFEGVTWSGNIATGAGSNGGAILVQTESELNDLPVTPPSHSHTPWMVVDGCTVQHNAAVNGTGGGLALLLDFGTEVAPDYYGWCSPQRPLRKPGPRAWRYGPGVLVVNSTVRGNVAEAAGGVSVSGGNVTLVAVVVEDNDVSGARDGESCQASGGVAGSHDTQVSTTSGLVSSSAGTRVTLDGCTFRNNGEATAGAGTIALTGGTQLLAASGTVLSAQDSSAAVPQQLSLQCAPGSTLSSQAKAVLTLRPPSVWVAAAGPFSPIDDMPAACAALTFQASGVCTPCPAGWYSLQTARVDLEWAPGSTALTNDTTVVPSVCLPCPYGGLCDAGGDAVRVLPGFWGQRVLQPRDELSVGGTSTACTAARTVGGKGGSDRVPTLAFTACPPKYCCDESQASKGHGGLGSTTSCGDPTGSCYGHRDGTLCGGCAPGYSAVFGTTACRKTAYCGAADLPWFVAGLSLAAVCFATYALVLARRKVHKAAKAAASTAAQPPTAATALLASAGMWAHGGACHVLRVRCTVCGAVCSMLL